MRHTTQILCIKSIKVVVVFRMIPAIVSQKVSGRFMGRTLHGFLGRRMEQSQCIFILFVLNYFLYPCSGMITQRHFQEELNYRGLDRVIAHTNVRSRLICVALCARSSGCAGTNFHSGSGLCELLASTCQGSDFYTGWQFTFKSVPKGV